MLQPSSISEARLFLLFSAPPRRFSAVGWAGWIPLHLRLDAAGLNPSATCLIIRPLQSGPHTHTYTHASTRTYTHTHTYTWLEYFWAITWRRKETGTGPSGL